MSAFCGPQVQPIEVRLGKTKVMCVREDQYIELLQMAHALRDERDAARKREATCHCGTALSAHHAGSGHQPVEMQPHCPYEAELAQLRSLLTAQVVKMVSEAPCTCPNPDGSYPHDPSYGPCYKNRLQGELLAG